MIYMFPESECAKRGHGSGLDTFDQPLYINAEQIVQSVSLGELNRDTVYLRGLHIQGAIESGSGLDDLW